ncbi:MAG TPA: wax ester/triacylglycerol synthase family O-acyltransferase, partial [Solirubrobacteraceae bacterium]|nr:wax ester/triacylglycerol synthase family O-acyltransferase [Solirubrobacteraceae bacterium]
MRQVSPTDAAWLALESRDTPMHVGGLFEFTLPPDAPADYLKQQYEMMREPHLIPPPWNLKLVDAPLLGPRVPLMREIHDVDLDYHVRHSALPHPGGQRELGILVSRLHSNELDMHRPLWEVHLIEGLEGNRFAMYSKTHHALIDGVSGMRLIMRALSTDPSVRDMPAFYTVGEGPRPQRAPEQNGSGPLSGALGLLRGGAATLTGLSRAAIDLGLAAVDDRPLQAPYRAPSSALGGRLGGQRRFATQQYELKLLRRLAKAADCTLNDIVLYLSGSALRRYLAEHARVPDRPLTAGIPVNLREAGDQSMGTAVGMIVAELGTNIANPRERLEAVKRSSSEAKRHLSELPAEARSSYA